MGELEAATRRTCGFGEEPVGGEELSQESGAGDRAKLGMRKASRGLDRDGCLLCSLSFAVPFVSGLFEDSAAFAFMT